VEGESVLAEVHRGPESRGEERTKLSRRDWGLLALALVLAAGLRAAYLLEISNHPLFTSLTGDPAAYHARALGILGGARVPDYPFFHSSPLYPFFLALVYRVTAGGPEAVRIIQAAIGGVSVFLIFELARLTVGVRAALVTAFLAAIYAPFMFFESEILEITLVIAFLAGMLVLLTSAVTSAGRLRAAAAGALLGLAALGKPNLLLFAPVGAFWLAAFGARPGAGIGHGRAPTGAKPVRARVIAAALFLAAAAIVVSPATIHNYRTSGDFIPVSSNGGINLFIGNHPGAPGVFQVPPEMRFDLRVASTEAAERAAGRRLTAGEVSSFWTGKAIEFMRRRPAESIGITAKKFALFWNRYEIPNHYHLYFVAGFAPVLRNPIGTFGVVAPLGLLGIALAVSRRRNAGILIAFGITFMLSVVPFFITARYRLAIVLVLLVGAGLACVELWDMARGRRWRPLALSAVSVAALAALVNVHMIEFGFAQMHNTVGAILGERGDLAGAAGEFEKALAENPEDLSARHNLGLALLELRRYSEAEREFRVAVGQHPRYHEAWLGLGKALAGEGRVDEAASAWRSLLAAEPVPPGVAAAAESLMRSVGDRADNDSR
jgi:4-amino-4-deoxy-L-arabinose transferase-like glycosyltransferase